MPWQRDTFCRLGNSSRGEWAEPLPSHHVLRLLASHGPPFPISDLAPETPWLSFALDCARCGCAPSCVGAAAATAVWFRAVCCHGIATRWRPTTKPILGLSVFVLLLLLTGIPVHVSGMRGMATIATQLHNVFERVAAAEALANKWFDDALDTLSALSALSVGCPELVDAQWLRIWEPLQDIQVQVRQLRKNTAHISEAVLSAHAAVQERARSTAVLLSLPVAAFVGSWGVTVYLVCSMRSYSRQRGRCTAVCQRFVGFSILAHTVVIVTMTAGTLLSLAFAVASFCERPDLNLLTCMWPITDEILYRFSSYYIAGGGGRNSFLEPPVLAANSYAKVMSNMARFRSVVKTRCKNGHDIDDFEQGIAKMDRMILRVQDMLHPCDMYPFFKVAVHDNICGGIAYALLWLALWHTVLGVACLPALAFLAECYAEQQAAARAINTVDPLVSAEMSPYNPPYARSATAR